jgi:CheY-like chemotaxis protein
LTQARSQPSPPVTRARKKIISANHVLGGGRDLTMTADRSDAPFACVVDDNPAILMHACDILEEAGFRTLSAYDGDEALHRLEKHVGDVTLLFTDVEMPGSIDGFELARLVAGRWPDIAILVASGQVSPREGDMPEGAIFVSKPFSADIVHDQVHRLLPDGRKPEPLKRKVAR